METATPRPRARQRANAAVRKADQRDKCTILLDRDTSIKLSVAAHLRGLDRSELVNQMLADSLRWVVISVRGQSNGSANGAVPVEPAGSDAA